MNIHKGTLVISGDMNFKFKKYGQDLEESGSNCIDCLVVLVAFLGHNG